MRKYLLMMAMPFIALSAFASGEENHQVDIFRADSIGHLFCHLFGYYRVTDHILT